jgi:hypothetical protein
MTWDVEAISRHEASLNVNVSCLTHSPCCVPRVVRHSLRCGRHEAAHSAKSGGLKQEAGRDTNYYRAEHLMTTCSAICVVDCGHCSCLLQIPMFSKGRIPQQTSKKMHRFRAFLCSTSSTRSAQSATRRSCIRKPTTRSPQAATCTRLCVHGHDGSTGTLPACCAWT